MKKEYSIIYNESNEPMELIGDNSSIKFDDIAFSSDDNVVINVDPFEMSDVHDNFYVKFISLLNKVTDCGCKVCINILSGLDVNFSLKANDVIANLVTLQDNVKNKDNIELMYIPIGQPVPFKECELIENAFNNAAQDINEKNFSPLEKIIAAYKIAIGIFPDDAVAYEKTDSYDKYTSIYNVPNVRPVCQSYAQIFEALCKRLDIKCESKTIIAHGMHAVDVINVEDEEYGVNGRYFFDVTLSKQLLTHMKNIGKISADALPVCKNAFGVGKDDMDVWATAYNNEVDKEEITWFKLSDSSIPDETIDQAQNAVDNAFVQHISHK